MIVTEISRGQRADAVVLSARVRSTKASVPAFPVEWVVRGAAPDSLSQSGDAFVASLLLPAMRLGEPLEITAPVSERLLRSARTIMDIYAAWVPDASRVAIHAEPAPARPPAMGRAVFFSCGVDSFYSLLKSLDGAQEDAVSHLVLGYGFDIRPGNRALFESVVVNAQRVATETGRQLVVVETNLRSFTDPIVEWKFALGGVLASFGLALDNLFGRCLIPSTHPYADLLPWGSSPLLDPLWSTDALEFVHDGCEASRSEKMARIVRNPLVLRTLRVCWPDWTTEYNCGRCEKCLRTMIALYAANALERCETFPRQLDVGAIRRMQLITGESSLSFLRDLVALLGDEPRHRDVVAALKSVIRRAVLRESVRHALQTYCRPALAAARAGRASLMRAWRPSLAR